MMQGWGVEIAMLFDITSAFGVDTITQVDLGVRRHRHRSLHTLSVQAAEVMATALVRIAPTFEIESPTLTRADGSLVPSTSPCGHRCVRHVASGVPCERVQSRHAHTACRSSVCFSSCMATTSSSARPG